MRFAVHHVPGSFSERWLELLTEQHIDHFTIDLFASDTMSRLRGADALLAPLGHSDPTALAFGHGILVAAEALGLTVFPSAALFAHFDDKVAQKYVLEAIGAPLVPTFIAHALEPALDFVDRAEMPLVFKLRRGAGSANVRLLRKRKDAIGICRRAFGRGFISAPSYASDAVRKVRGIHSLKSLVAKVARAPSMIRVNLETRATMPRERGYVYFQQFIPGLTHDVRVAIIGNRAFTFRRRVRPGDFRASGSGLIEHVRPDNADREAIACAFKLAAALNHDSLAFDFVVEPDTGRRLVVEMSYGYQAEAVHNCTGYFTPELEWIPGHVWPEHAILSDMQARLHHGAGASPPPQPSSPRPGR